jgi:Zn-dependent M28 family amino/carboxypeptidase
MACLPIPAATTAAPSSERSFEARIRLGDILEHLEALQTIADRNGGNRLAGTPGYDSSARYVATRMRAAGYDVRLQEFVIPVVVNRSPPRLRRVGATAWTFRPMRDYSTLAYSGSGKVEAQVVAVDLRVPSPRPNASTSGCDESDFADFPVGAVALLQRGSCRFRVKVDNAIVSGASAAVVFNEGNKGRRQLFAGTLGPPQVRVPVLGASFALGDAVRNGRRDGPTAVTVRLRTDMIAERRTTRNVIAESRTGDRSNVVVVGAHLDSVERGPGINDNGSGSAVILEVAERLADARPRNRLRFAWWSAEELGLLGSRHYVRRLSTAARRRIALYLNLDMVGSPNFVRFVYDGDGSVSPRRRPRLPAESGAIERVFSQYFLDRGLPYREVRAGGSDHLSFARAGIPVGGLFTGADGRKTAAEAAVYGGQAGEAYDPCYHRPCDRRGNVGGRALSQVAKATLNAIETFMRDTWSVKRR